MDIPPTATLIGDSFAELYYNTLQNKPEEVHRFYFDSSKVLRIDGDIRESASSKQEIDALLMSLKFKEIEIGCVDSVETWGGGVLVNVYGSAQFKHYNVRRQFEQIVFLAPKENGFFVSNDIFRFIDESVHYNPALLLAQSNLDSESKLIAASTINQPDTHSGEFVATNEVKENDLVDNCGLVATNEVKENGLVDNCGLSEQQMQQGHDVAEESHSQGSSQPTLNAEQDLTNASANTFEWCEIDAVEEVPSLTTEVKDNYTIKSICEKLASSMLLKLKRNSGILEESA